MVTFNEDLVAYLECPVCFEYMAPPIRQCEEGHSICNRCFFKMNSCPTCRSKLSELCRNFSMENIFEKLPLPCKNRDSGCKEVQPGWKILEHQLTCKLEPKECPLKMICNCTWIGIPERELQHHCIEQHATNFITEPSMQMVHRKFFSSEHTSGYSFNIFHVHGEFFRCVMEINLSKRYLRWCVFLLGRSDTQFEFRIEVFNSFDADVNIVLRSPCPELRDSNYFDLQNSKFIFADYDDMKCLSYCDDFAYTISINKICI